MNAPVIDFDPTIFSIGFIQIRWYGLMYVIGFLFAGFIAKKLVKNKFFKVPIKSVDNLVTIVIICMLICARIFYVFVYNWSYYRNNLLEILFIWKGGLSFHGALIGFVIAAFIFSKKYKVSWFQVTDVMALAGSPALLFGRIGNFINGELYGRTTDLFLGMIFPSGGPYPRHPSQLYEGFFEGIALPLTLWFVILPRAKYYGSLSCGFLIGYGIFRFFIEFFRQPDSQLGYYFYETTTMGQILCIIMVVIGIFMIFSVKNRKLKI